MAQRKVASTIEGYLSLITNNIQNAKRRNKYECEIDIEYMLELYKLQEGKCAISGIEMTWGFEDNREAGKQYRKPFNLSVDRVDSTKGYTKDNVILICNIVNFFKNNYDICLMYDVAHSIVQNYDRLEHVLDLMRDKLDVEIQVNCS